MMWVFEWYISLDCYLIAMQKIEIQLAVNIREISTYLNFQSR